MTELSKQYDPAAHETQIYQKWESAGAFAPDETLVKSGKKPFVIMLPPPNITGSLHMGHALEHTIIDILIRHHRMLGQPTLWLPGTDSAAIATNKVVESQLAKEGKTRQDIGREGFQERVEAWYKETGSEIIRQMKQLGDSCDWSRLRFTLDDAYVQAVNEAFIRYYKKGYIYRGDRIVNWDPASQSTVSDLEIDWKTEKVPFYTFQYGPFQISTARPETKFGDKYVVIHPEDSRYQNYSHGQKIELEWINGPITATIIKDSAVDPAFGTGVMTITPWHDITDFEIAERHQLDKEQIIGFDGKLLPIAGEFAGQTITQARPKIVEKLKEKELLVGVNENYEHNVALNDRGKGVIEPQIMRQWFLNMSKIKLETIAAAEKELVKFRPGRWKKHFLTWMRGVRDWNINRQIWLGHRLPVWWKSGTHGTNQEEGSYVVSLEKPTGDYEQDPDVLDTWFSSALWPFATLGWPNQTEDLKNFYPTSILTSARDIVYLWDARMIFSGLEFMQKIPFPEVFIHPTVMAKNGQRMSKSLGTGVDPLELIEKYGADATRFGLIYQMSYDSQAIKFDEEAIKAARNFANKLWNIARFLENLPPREKSSIADRWVGNRLSQVTSEVTRLLKEYKFGEAAHILHEFIWKDFADWYVEILKVEGSTATAHEVFQQTLVLLHPFMPHITEVLWRGDTMLIFGPWLKGRNKKAGTVEQKMERFQALVNTIRSARALLALPPAEEISVSLPRPPLKAALESLTRSKVSSRRSARMKAFPTSQGETVWIHAESITEASLQEARQRLQKQAEELEGLLANQRRVLTQMQGKASPEKVAEKEKIVAEAENRLKEVTHSLELLK